MGGLWAPRRPPERPCPCGAPSYLYVVVGYIYLHGYCTFVFGFLQKKKRESKKHEHTNPTPMPTHPAHCQPLALPLHPPLLPQSKSTFTPPTQPTHTHIYINKYNIYIHTLPIASRLRFRSIRSSSSRSRIRSNRAFSGSIVVSKRLMALLFFFLRWCLVGNYKISMSVFFGGGRGMGSMFGVVSLG